MIGRKKKNLQLLKESIDISIVNKTLLEKAYLLLKDIKDVEYISDNIINRNYQEVNVNTFKCVGNKNDLNVTFNFDKSNNKNFSIIVNYPDKDENIDVYNVKKNTIVSIQKKENDSFVYLYFARYINNKLNNITESLNLDSEDPNLKRVTKTRLVDKNGSKEVTTTYDKEVISKQYYTVDYLDSNLKYNNARDMSNKFEYSEKLIFEIEYTNNNIDTNKKILSRK